MVASQYPLETMLRIHLLQNWFSLSDPAMERALYRITSMRQFSSNAHRFNSRRHDTPYALRRQRDTVALFLSGGQAGDISYAQPLLDEVNIPSSQRGRPRNAVNGCLPTRATTLNRYAVTATNIESNPSSRCAQ